MTNRSNDPITVRFARPDDLPELLRRDPWPQEKRWRQRVLAQEAVAIERGGELVGLARYTVLWTTVPFLELIFVDEAHRGLGLSRRLLGFLETHLVSEGFTTLLSSSQTDEGAAQAWHLHMGFRSNGLIENIADEGVGELVYRLTF